MVNFIDVPGGTIVYIRQNGINVEYTLNQITWTIVDFPFEITNTNTSMGLVKIYFTTNINIKDDNQYFTFKSNYIQFGSESLNSNGMRPTINVSSDYNGLFYNDVALGKASNIYIFNLFVNGIVNGIVYGTLNSWICRNGFSGLNNYIINCSSNGTIYGYSGGIASYASAYNSGVLYIIGCSSSGQIEGQGGGIAGPQAGISNGKLFIDSCWTSGNIIGPGGGIIGGEAINFQITNSYTTGAITGAGAGGLVGLNCCSPVLYPNGMILSGTIKNCYSTGIVLSQYGGGICGRNCFYTTAINCYTTGNLQNNLPVGGIFGYNVYYNSVNSGRIAINCYVTGKLLSSVRMGYIYASETILPPSCYSEGYNYSDGWKDLNANTALLETPSSLPGIGNTWISTNINTPYSNINIGYTPYSNKIIYNNNLIKTSYISIAQGETTGNAIISSLSYKILKITDRNLNSYNFINFNTNTGAMTIIPPVSAGSYTVYISNTGMNFNGNVGYYGSNSLYFSTYTLNIYTIESIKNNFLDLSNNFSPSVYYPCKFNLLKSTYFLNFLDISGDLIVRNGSLSLTNGDISGNFNLCHYYGNYNDTNIKHSIYDSSTNKLIFNGIADISNNIYFYNNISFQNNKTGENNIALGVLSLSENKSGNFNVAIGYNSGNNIVSQNYNTCIGSNTGIDISTNNYNYSTAIGYNAKITGNNIVVLGTSNENVYVPGSLLVNTPIDICGNIILSNSSNYFTSVSGQMIFSSNNGNIIFNGAVSNIFYENLRINNDGYVGINNSTPTYNFHVNGTSLFSNGTKYSDGTLYVDKFSGSSKGTFVLSPIMSGGNIYSGQQNDDKYNIGIGTNALNTINSMTTSNYGSNNTSMGINSLYNCTTGSYNTALGSKSLYGCTTGFYNTAVGCETLYNCTTGSYNSAFGCQSLYGCTTGSYNSALGYQSLYSCTTGSYNSALGYQSLYNCTIGNYNSALGYQSLYNCTIGNYNSALGYQSLYNCTIGNYNSAFGYKSLYSCTTGINSGFGDYSLYNCTTGIDNSAFGYQSLYSCTIGNNNTCIGHNPLYFCTTGSNNVSIGTNSGYKLTTANNNIFIGHNSGYNTTIEGNNIAIGYNSLFNNTIGNNNIAIGNVALYYNITGGNNIAIGNNSGLNNYYQNDNIFIGNYTSIDISTNNWGNSVALGNYATITASDQIVLGGRGGNVYVPGNMWINGYISGTSLNTISDKRVKENIILLDETYSVDNLRPIIYENILLKKKEIGFLAHEVQEHYPFLVEGEKDGELYQSVNYNGLISICANELIILKKEQKQLLEELKTQIQTIKKIKKTNTNISKVKFNF